MANLGTDEYKACSVGTNGLPNFFKADNINLFQSKGPGEKKFQSEIQDLKD